MPAPVNWATIQMVAGYKTLDSGNGYWSVLTEEDLTIDGQAGSDFTIGPSSRDGRGAVYTGGGGHFLAAAYITVQEFGSPRVTLDAGSTKQRFAWFGAITSPLLTPMRSFGIDVQLPVVIGDDDPNGINQAIGVSTLAYCGPGTTVIDPIGLSLIQPFGTDSVPVTVSLAVWQV